MPRFFQVLLALCMGVPAGAQDVTPANAVVYEQWRCSEVAFWRIDTVKLETPQVVREALRSEPQCALATTDVVRVEVAMMTALVEMVLPLSAATVEEAGYGVNLYLPIMLDITAPVH